MQPALPGAPALKVTLLALSLLPWAGADLPVHCLRHQIQGKWDFFLGPASAERSSCGHESPDHEERQPQVSLAEVQEQKRITLGSPNVAQTPSDDGGHWTMIYDEGFEVNVDGLSFFAFSKFDLSFGSNGRHNVSRCGETQLGWYHSVDRARWGCYYAKKIVEGHEGASLLGYAPAPRPKTAFYEVPLSFDFHSMFAAGLNALQSLWTAKPHDRLVGKSLRELNSMAGISRPRAARAKRPTKRHHGAQDAPDWRRPLVPAGVSFLQAGMSRSSRRGASVDQDGVEDLPRSWDWRNVSGVSYLDEVLDQGECGSCYIVATTRMLSARHRIRQRDPSLEAFSIEFPLYCSEYNQGCGGGYAFLASRWAQDVGLVPQSCGHYASSDGRCSLQCDAGGLGRRKWRADNHHYVGGYYGAASELPMMREVARSGPIVVSFEPKADIMYYSGGIYSSTENQHAEWEQVDHAVLLVGYGEENGKKYWVLQNSWGDNWGEDGFFRMARGTDESGVESIAVAADVTEDTRPSVLLEFARRL